VLSQRATRFRYLADPVCLAAWLLYALNRLVVKPLSSPATFVHTHFNDLLLVPALLPVVLWLFRRAGVRDHDRPPTRRKLIAHTLAWCVVFEIIGPRLLHRGVSDPVDAACYLAGAAVAGLVWRRLYPSHPVIA
jgi:hypothetical protein